MKPVSLIVILASLILNTFANADTSSNTIDTTHSTHTDISSSEEVSNPVDFWGNSILSVFNHIEDATPAPEDIYGDTMSSASDDDNDTYPVHNPVDAEPGDFTAGGYAPTTPDARYKDNGISVSWVVDNGLLFDTTQTQDLYNFVKSGYTSLRTVDARIQSRKGGENNPRIAWFESFKLGEDNTFVTNTHDAWTGNTVTVTYDKINCSKELSELLKKPMMEDTDGDGLFETYTENFDKMLELNEKEDVVAELGMTEGSFSVTYNFRNYCGDVLEMAIRGPSMNDCSSYLNIGDTETGKRLAGVDYTLTCEEDPDAFKLISGDELKNYYSFETKWGNSINESNTQTLVSNGLNNGPLEYRQPVTNCSDYNIAGVTENNVLGAGAQYYTGVKPGIYHCTITLKDGKQIPIVIENLPIHYETLLWGCRTQAEMDVCIKFAQNGNQGVYGQYIGGTCIRANNSRGKGTDKELFTTDEKDYKAVVKDFNDCTYTTYEGDIVQLKNTKKAADWWLHYTNIYAEYYVLGKPGMQGTYRALDAMMRKGGDCETYSAFMSCMLNVTGYTTRYITGGNHAWIEVKVPGEITQSGEDQWLAIDNGELMEKITANDKKRMVKTTIYNEVKGWDTYWNADMPR